MKLLSTQILLILKGLFNITFNIFFMFIISPIIMIALFYYFIKFTIEHESESTT